ncbi:MAG: VWA domain-containing protein [Candidatus Acidiferrales bacterium]
MYNNARVGCLLLAAALCAGAASSQQSSPPAEAGNTTIHLDVVVTPKSGLPVPDLQQQDFTLLDDKAPQAITSFKAVSGREARLEVIIVIDAINTNFDHVAFERTEIDKFLREEGGRLAYPIAVTAFTGKGMEILANFSRDGNVLSASLDRADVGLRAIGNSAGYYGEAERLQLSLQTLRQLISSETPRPGRKLMLWVSPGWPLMSGPDTEMGSKQQEQVFENIVSFSTQLRQSRVTLYSVDPLGAVESVNRSSYYEEFIKGVSKASQVYMGDMGLQVLAIQSGGLALNRTNDIAELLQQCLADAAPYYEITFDPPAAKKQDEYHRLEIKLAKPGLTARTRQGYYAQPLSHD